MSRFIVDTSTGLVQELSAAGATVVTVPPENTEDAATWTADTLMQEATSRDWEVIDL